MKKRLLAMLLVLMMVVSLLPVGALADGDIWDGHGTFSYHITDSSLNAMVAKYNNGPDSDVDSVSITFKEPYTYGGQDTFVFRYGYTIDLSNKSDAVQPDDIDCLNITLENGNQLRVPGTALDWTWVNTHPRRYDLSLDAGEGLCTVTFYVQSGDSFDNSAWMVYQTINVPVRSALGTDMPALPTQEDPDAHWMAWEIGSHNGDGRELHADTVITGDMIVYARKTLPSSGGEEIRVMGPENDFIDVLKEKLNVETIEINGISAFGGGEETNPYYDPSRVTEDPTENGWKDDGAYYRVMNTDQVPVPDDVPEHNDRVAPGELEGIKIYATVDGVNDTVITLNRSDLDVCVDQTVLRIYLREATEPDTPVEPEIPDEPTTDPDVSGVGIVVDCTANDAHASETLDVIDNTYDFHKAWDGDQWTCTVVIDPDDYVDTYNEAVSGHALNPANQTGELLYVYSNGSWEYVREGSPTVTFTVVCSGTDPDPDEPPEPTDADLRKLAVVLKCVNEDVEHTGDPKTFNLRTTNCTYDIKQDSGQYICTVTPNYDLILERYNEQVAGGHTYADEVGSEKTFTLVWTGKAWDNGNASPITRQVKCDTPEPENQHVDVYAVKDRNYDTRVLIGSFMAPVGTNVINFVEAQELDEPEGFDKYEPANDGYYRDGLEYTFGENDTVSGWTNVYVNYIGKEQTVNVVIYRNGDTTTPYATIDVPGYKTGDTIYTEDFDINNYYAKDKFATGFVFDGWFDDGRWNNYKYAGCPEEDFTTVDEIYVNGWKNVIAMVWDVYPVNYHVLDEDGKEIDTHHDTITARELDKGTWTPEVDPGYEFDGWYQDKKDIGKENKLFGGFYMAKKYELYGELVSLAPEEGPNEDDLAQLTVRVNDNKNAPVNHGGKNLGLIEGCYDVGEIVEKDGIYTVTVTPTVAEYAKQYDIAKGFVEGSHTATTSQSKVHSFVFTWTNGEWELTSDDSVTIGVKCSVTVPTADELAELLQIRVKDYAGAEELPVGVTDHGQFVTGILEDTYSITGPAAENNTFVATVTLTDGSAYAAAYDENRQLEAGTHALTTTVSKLDPITLTYDFTTGTWSASNTGWSLGVKCEQVINTIHVSFVGPNGEAYGGGDVISTMPDVSVEIADPVAEGKTFVGWKKLVGLEEIYTGEFTYTALAALVGDNFTPDTHETWLEFEAVFEDEIIEPDPYNTIHVSFVGPNGEAYGGGDVISTMPDVSVEIADPVAEGKTFVGWKKLVGLEEIYTGEFTYTALAALVGDNFTPDTHETWLEFEAVFEDEIIEPDPYNIINIRFVDSDGTTSLGGGDVISTSPDAAYPSVPSPVAPQGMEFAGWKVWLGSEPMYEGEFTYNALKALREELDGEITWVDGRTWITFQAVYEDVTVEPDPGVTGFTKTLVTDRDLYNARGIAYPDFYRGTVIVDEGDRVTLIYNITVKGTAGTEFTVRDDSADFAQTGVIPSSGETSFYVAKTFSWRDVRNAGDTLDNTASVSVDGETVKTDTERVPVDIDWDINVPDIDDDDDDDVAEPDDEYIPNWLNTTDHYAYIVGYEDGTIRPQNNITRAEVATIFFRLLTDNARERYWSTTNDFSDVAAESWYNNAISTLSNMGIINGYEDGTFKPNAPITRAEFTAIATRFFDYEAEYDGAFNDVSARAWYADYVQAAVDMGLVDGYPDGGFHPDAYITRAEACTIVNRVLHRVPHEDHLLSESVMNTWPDNPKSAWYYEDMQEATNSHDYDWIRVDGETVEDWTKKLPERDWSALETEWATAYSR